MNRCLWGGIEIAVCSAGYACLLWLIGPNLQVKGIHALTLLGLFLSALYLSYVSPVLIHRDSLQARGLGTARTLFVRTDNLRDACLAYGLITLIGGALLVTWAIIRDPLLFVHLDWNALFLKLPLYFLSGTAQSMVVFQFIVVRLKTILGAEPREANRESMRTPPSGSRFWVAFLTGMWFCLSHFPNVKLMGVALLEGVVWSWVYYMTPNLFLVAASHAILGTILHRIVALYMRVGPFYWQPDKYIFRELFPVFARLIGANF